ncbi:MAG TPA: hypothetical protein VM305_03160 [Candidatus Limnocylindrales bacterium]|nr:hypothetical protein [Candidatus Limnocylindrales bacterium]
MVVATHRRGRYLHRQRIAGQPGGSQVEWDVVGDVQAFVAQEATNRGWRINDTSELASSLLASTLSFGSREAASSRPTLLITYAP